MDDLADTVREVERAFDEKERQIHELKTENEEFKVHHAQQHAQAQVLKEKVQLLHVWCLFLRVKNFTASGKEKLEANKL